MSIFAQNPC